MRDLLLSFDLVRAWGDGSLAVRWSDGTTDFQFHVNPSTERYQVLRNGQVLPDGKGRLPGPIGRNQFELSTMDHQYIVAMDRKVIGTWPGVPVEEPDRPTDTPVQIGVMRLGAVIEHVRLFRDVYYTHPTGLRARWGVGRPVQLGSRELFVLGDNSPVSEDSRTWEGGPGVAVTLLTGRPLLIHFPSRQIRLGPWEFQVPDPTRMRYIP